MKRLLKMLEYFDRSDHFVLGAGQWTLKSFAKEVRAMSVVVFEVKTQVTHAPHQNSVTCAVIQEGLSMIEVNSGSTLSFVVRLKLSDRLDQCPCW
jgi:hypothetical protein